ncbi:hypothetical protein [Acidovorax sp. BLS4]|uniref:hypothetical protein n=1 Tax=Acidovorax sp. BLS4 TaxID=3273430 RepID=UPI0029432ABC|nr:hypothetical protein [Paracidovorax avenae]WOI47006.1 hypothetical protein R1Z03_07275 [Paracidovorax avenae]
MSMTEDHLRLFERVVAHLLQRIRSDPRMAFLAGPGSELFDLATAAAAAAGGFDEEWYSSQFAENLTYQAVPAIHGSGEPAARQYWAVFAPCGQGVIFTNAADARWTHTGIGTGSDGFGVPRIGFDFREAYGTDPLTLERVQIVPADSAANATQEGGTA